jgi:hypothetical protein
LSSKITSKKKKQLTHWPRRSLFHKIVSQRFIKTHFGDYEWFFCDDPGREIADFLIASFKDRKIAFIHCKWGKGSKLSASAFHDLCSQAAKNLVYIHTKRYPPKINTWVKDSTWENTKIKKWIKGDRNIPVKKALWEKIKNEILDHPDGKTEIWLTMGDGLDITKLIELTGNESRNMEVGPMLHLLDGLVANCAEAGANFRVFGHGD